MVSGETSKLIGKARRPVNKSQACLITPHPASSHLRPISMHAYEALQRYNKSLKVWPHQEASMAQLLYWSPPWRIGLSENSATLFFN